MSGFPGIHDSTDEEFVPGTPSKQQIHQAINENKEETIVQAEFNQLGIELNDNSSSMPCFPISITSKEINQMK